MALNFNNLLTGQQVAIVWIMVNTLIFFPYAVYQTYLFNKYKNRSSFIYERKPNMAIKFSICALLTVVFAMPVGYGYEIFSNKQGDTQHYGYIAILYFVGATFIIGFWRAWHIWYDTQYKMEAATNAWSKHLDNTEKNFFTTYKDSFGNTKWTSTYIIILAIILSIIFIVLVIFELLAVVEAIVVVTILIVFIGLLIVIKKLSEIHDEIKLRQEYILFASAGLIYAGLYVLLYALFHDWNESDPIHLEILYDALYMVLPSPILYILILIQTQWVLYQYKKIDINRQKRRTTDTDKITVKELMSDYEGYKAFMQYLVKCVSAENLLFVSEAIQFMKDLTKRYNITGTSIQYQSYFDQYDIPTVLPLSSIMTDVEAVSIRYLKICEKYILRQSEFEINISYKNRQNLVKIYQTLERKVNKLNPKINKLAKMFGDESILQPKKNTVSRKASNAVQRKQKTPKTPKTLEINRNESTESNFVINEDDDVVKHENNKLAHSCVEDSQLLGNKEIIQNIHDCLCSTFGDVYTNLNDGCLRFMETETYFRWYDNYKKENVLSEEEEPPSDDTENDNDNDDADEKINSHPLDIGNQLLAENEIKNKTLTKVDNVQTENEDIKNIEEEVEIVEIVNPNDIQDSHDS